MKSNISYLPGAEAHNLATKITDLWRLIHSDFLRLEKYTSKLKETSSQNEEQHYNRLQKKCRWRIMDRLERMIQLPLGNWNEEMWTDTLKRSVEIADKKTPLQISEDTITLINTLLSDTTRTKVQFAIKCLEIIAKIPPDKLILVFKPI